MTATLRPARLLLALGLALAVVVALLVGDPAPSRAVPDERPVAAKPKGGKGKISWDVTAFGPGGAVVAHGKLPGKGKRKVRLQVRTKGSWQTFGSTKSDRKGNFAISAPLKWYGEHKVRATTAGRRPFNKRTKVTVSPAYAPRGGAGDWAYNTFQGLRMMQNPCQTLKYSANVDDVGQPGLDMILASMEQLEYATGVKTKFVGLTSVIPFRTPNDRKVPGKADMIIGWATEAEVSELAGNVGVTRYMNLRTARDGRRKKAFTITDSAIVLNTDLWYGGNYTQGFIGTKPVFGKTVLHELGHAFGLEHVDPLEPMMHPGLIATHPDGNFIGRFEAGDLGGLDATGLGTGCHRPAKFAGYRGELSPPDVF